MTAIFLPPFHSQPPAPKLAQFKTFCQKKVVQLKKKFMTSYVLLCPFYFFGGYSFLESK